MIESAAAASRGFKSRVGAASGAAIGGSFHRVVSRLDETTRKGWPLLTLCQS